MDTSAIVAIAHAKDERHDRAMALLKQAEEAGVAFLLTNFLVAETYALLLSRGGADLARNWLLGNDIPIQRISATDETRTREILLKYRDKSFSYVDASSFAVMERLGLDTAFTFDQHFRQYGWKIWGDGE